MKLAMAMKILKLSKTFAFEGDTEDLKEAHQLGIEAMERIIEYHHIDNSYQNLPSETR